MEPQVTDLEPTASAPDSPVPPAKIVDAARDAAQSAGFKAQIYRAIAVQRPVVLGYLRSLRREKPDASAAEILKELDRRYVATVTLTSAGVGASAAIPGVGIPLALGLGVADLLFFYETSALYVLAVAELHGIEVSDPERAQPLVSGMLLGQKSQSEVSKFVLAAAGAGSIDRARSAAAGALPKGWGEVLTQQLPDSALAPVAALIAKEALKRGGKIGAGTLGKTIPFGVGAVVGGVGSFVFGRDVVKAARLAFPQAPDGFPEELTNFLKPERDASAISEQPRALAALHGAAGNVADFAEDVWDKVTDAADVFRSVDLDGDGTPDEARALTAAKGAGSAIKGAVAGAAGSVAGVLKRKQGKPALDDAEPTDEGE